jgi:hypothetical protein
MLSRAGVLIGVLAGLLGSAVDAPADAQTPPDKTAAPAPKKRPKVRRGPVNRTGPVATFPGFRLLSGGASRVYVQLTAPVPVEPHAAKGVLTYTLKGARVISKNNKNALITTHFSSPVSRVRLVTSGMDLDVVIELRSEAAGAHRIVTDPDGTARLEVDFAAGSFPLEPSRFTPDPNKPRSSKAQGKADKTAPPEPADDEKDEPPVGPPEP